MVVAGRLAPKYKNFIESLKTYKYRNDVILTGDVNDEELGKLIGSAYALVYPSGREDFCMPVAEAMNSHIPVITSPNSALQEIAGDAALYADPVDHEDIANKMMLLYKDETLRNSLIEKGKKIAAYYSWDKAVELFWQSILKAIK